MPDETMNQAPEGEETYENTQAMVDAVAEREQKRVFEQEGTDPGRKKIEIKDEDLVNDAETAPDLPESSPLSSLEPQAPEDSMGKLDFILDVPLQVTVNLGKTKMLIKELLQLGQGSVVELEKMAGEPMDVFIGERLIARGEVVVVNEKFGVRLTDIVSSVDRVKYLTA